MTNDQEQILDDLLSRWHHWCDQARVARGYNTRALVVGDFRVSRQYDDENGSLDHGREESKMEAIDHEVAEMRDPWRAAIHAQARALYYGCAVFSSARLPANREERMQLIASARVMLLRRLASAGVL